MSTATGILLVEAANISLSDVRGGESTLKGERESPLEPSQTLHTLCRTQRAPAWHYVEPQNTW
jgi:hypothetical protein